MDLSSRRNRYAVCFVLASTWLALSPAAEPVRAAEAGAAKTEEGPTAEVAVDRWLVAGPVAAPMPAFAAETGVARREALEPAALLPAWPYEAGEAWPEAGAAFPWPGGDLAWSERQGTTLDLGAGAGAGAGGARLAWIATFVDADRFVDAKLTVTTPHRVRVWLDGEPVAEKAGADGAKDDAKEQGDAKASGRKGGEDPAGGDDATGTASAELKLFTGKHLLLVAAVTAPDEEGAAPPPWHLAASLTVAADRTADLAVSASPQRGVTVRDLLDPPQVSAVDLSADGTLLAVTLDQPAVPADDHVSWVEIVRAADGSPVETLRLPTSVDGFTWAPSGHGFAYTTSADGKATLWLGDLDSGSRRPLLSGVEGLSRHLWAADGESLFVQLAEPAEKDERGVQRVRSMADRWAGYRDLGSVYQVSLTDGRRRRLTAGPFTTDLEDVAPDGRRLLLSRTRYVAEPPFSHGELWELDLATLEATKLRDVVWFGSASYSPDGATVLVLAGPSAFGDLGRNVPPGTIPNEYDRQAYLLDRASGEVSAISRDFDPAIDDARWAADGSLVLQVTETSYGRLYRWRPPAADGTGGFSRLAAGPDVAGGLSVARSAPTVAYTGSSLQAPGSAWVLDDPAAAGAAGREVVDAAAADFAQVRFGRVEDFDFTTAAGEVIPGRLYYPLDFDPAKRYPLITYYYGGVVPTERSFAGRYPKNLWAANGYAVYVLQPSGAIGFGQRRSAVHVNDWGEVVVGEIVAGVDAVLAAHPFLDGAKVGCFGGSYGGFLTLRLVTDSDRFAGAISHAGISGIASYWGEGWWGFLYMATAASGSYPWNRPDLFVERSPLFKADRVETPLLLIHGTADPNVPPGESDQMFAALRVLGKEVEYVRISGEQHWILTYPKRVLWWQTILAWFDRTLKDQPQAWEELWGGELERGGP